MIYDGELFGEPIFFYEEAESAYSDKNLPGVRYDRDRANELIGRRLEKALAEIIYLRIDAIVASKRKDGK